MDQDLSNRRRRTRVPVRLKVTIRCDGQEIPVESRNLSLKGLACGPDRRFRENCCCEVILRLATDLQAVIRGRVVRASDTETAIDFLAMDPESFFHLLRIVEHHAPAGEAVLRELLKPAFPLSRPRVLVLPPRKRS